MSKNIEPPVIEEWNSSWQYYPLFVYGKFMGGACSALAQCIDFHIDGLTLRPYEKEHNDCKQGYFAYVSQKRSDTAYIRLQKQFDIELQVLDSCSLVFVYSYSPEPTTGNRKKSRRSPKIEIYRPGEVIKLSNKGRIDFLITCIYGLDQSFVEQTKHFQNEQIELLLRLNNEFIDSSIYPPDFKTANQMSKAFERTLLKIIKQPDDALWHSTLFKPTGKPLPDGLSKAAAFIAENPSWEFCADQLSEICQLSQRSVYYQFKKYRQMTPYRYYQIQRLYYVRQQILSNHASEDKISYHAFNAGFYHLGRFSSFYKEVFGELPIKTRMRRNLMNGATKTALIGTN